RRAALGKIPKHPRRRGAPNAAMGRGPLPMAGIQPACGRVGMLADMQTIRAMLALCTAVLLAGALPYAPSVFAPVAFSLLVIALVWPLQQTLETKLPRLLASALVMATTLFVIIALTAVVAWGFSMIAEWLAQNAGRFQSLHWQATQWLEQHGI